MKTYAIIYKSQNFVHGNKIFWGYERKTGSANTCKINC